MMFEKIMDTVDSYFDWILKKDSTWFWWMVFLCSIAAGFAGLVFGMMIIAVIIGKIFVWIGAWTFFILLITTIGGFTAYGLWKYNQESGDDTSETE